MLSPLYRGGGFPCGSAGKESAYNVGDLGSILGLGRSPGEGKGYPLQYSGLENAMDYIVHGVTRDGHNWMTFTWLLALQMRSVMHWENKWSVHDHTTYTQWSWNLNSESMALPTSYAASLLGSYPSDVMNPTLFQIFAGWPVSAVTCQCLAGRISPISICILSACCGNYR